MVRNKDIYIYIFFKRMLISTFNKDNILFSRVGKTVKMVQWCFHWPLSRVILAVETTFFEDFYYLFWGVGPLKIVNIFVMKLVCWGRMNQQNLGGGVFKVMMHELFMLYKLQYICLFHSFFRFLSLVDKYLFLLFLPCKINKMKDICSLRLWIIY